MIEYNKSVINKKILIMTEIEDDYNDQFSTFFKEKMVTVEFKSLKKKES